MEHGVGEVSDNEFNTISGDAYYIMFVHSNTESSPITQKLSSKVGIPSTWILLDSQSTIDVFCNTSLLSQIHKTNTTMHIRCNAGAKSTNLRGHLSGYCWVWYFPGGIANILSLSCVKEKY